MTDRPPFTLAEIDEALKRAEGLAEEEVALLRGDGRERRADPVKLRPKTIYVCPERGCNTVREAPAMCSGEGPRTAGHGLRDLKEVEVVRMDALRRAGLLAPEGGERPCPDCGGRGEIVWATPNADRPSLRVPPEKLAEVRDPDGTMLSADECETCGGTGVAEEGGEPQRTQEQISGAARLALTVARSAVLDGRDVGPNTVGVLILELDRLAARPVGENG